ncbi:embigin [Echeneis naucrates]|uniref:embigin n=1 Tax=Echeneis naucrates TaxID=173247 RepID=UPI00111423F7|nr:embigin [Echeneis naucrates]
MRRCSKGRKKRPSRTEDRDIIVMSASWKQLFFQIFLLLITCRHINTKTSIPTSAPGVSITPLPLEVRSVVLKGESHTEIIELFNPVALTLKCTWTGGLNPLPNITGYWRKDGDELENSRVTLQLVNKQYDLTRELRIVSEENLGNYSCVFGNEAKVDFILEVPQVGDVRDKPIVSYVGDYAVIFCKIQESKPMPVSWNWYKLNGTDKEQIVVDEKPPRYLIKSENRNTKLLVNNLREADSGWYYCEAVYAISTAISRVELKVISFWEPLKPFLVILVEVILLVAAILLYERSQSQKTCPAENGTNAGETNTQVQTENNGSDESSSMRQRKV